MAEEKMKKTVSDFLDAFQKKEVDKALSFCTGDVTWVTPHGTFKGNSEVKRYMTWTNQAIPDMAVSYCGVEVMTQGNKAVCEHILSGTIEGKKWEVLGMCAYEFSDGKIQNIRTVFDRLALAKQVATGFMAKKAVNSIINAMGKGL